MTNEQATPTAEQLQTAEAVNRIVLQWLKTKYFQVALLLALTSPVLGFVAGLMMESSLLSGAQDKLVEETAKNLDAKVALLDDRLKVAEAGSEKQLSQMQELRSQAEKEVRGIITAARGEVESAVRDAHSIGQGILGTKQAIDILLSASNLGRAVSGQAAVLDLDQKVEQFRSQLSRHTEDVARVFPLGLSAFSGQLQELTRLKESVDQLQALLKNNEAAAALAGTFYRIDELSAELVVMVAIPFDNGSPDDPEKVSCIVAGKDKIKCVVRMMKRAEMGDESRVLAWECPVADAVAEDLPQTPVQPQGGPTKGLRLTWKLADAQAWWRYSDKPGTTKTINITDFSSFDCLDIEFSIPAGSDGDRIYESLSRCRITGKTSARRIALSSRFNRVLVQSEPCSGDGELRVQPGRAAADAGPNNTPPPTSALPNTVRWTFVVPGLFGNSSALYTTALSKSGRSSVSSQPSSTEAKAR